MKKYIILLCTVVTTLSASASNLAPEWYTVDTQYGSDYMVDVTSIVPFNSLKSRRGYFASKSSSVRMAWIRIDGADLEDRNNLTGNGAGWLSGHWRYGKVGSGRYSITIPIPWVSIKRNSVEHNVLTGEVNDVQRGAGSGYIVTTVSQVLVECNTGGNGSLSVDYRVKWGSAYRFAGANGALVESEEIADITRREWVIVNRYGPLQQVGAVVCNKEL